MADINKAAGIIIVDRKVLVERSKGKKFFIAPGGKIETGESATQTLKRELREELDIETEESDFEFFGTFKAEAANHPSQIVEMHAFIVKDFMGKPAANNEVDEILWVNTINVDDKPVGSIIRHSIMPLLKNRNLID